MGLFEQFPYTNFHQINLDWFLNAWSEFQADINNRITEFENDVNSDINSFKTDINNRFNTFTSQINKAMKDFQNETKQDINAFKSSINSQITTFKNQVNSQILAFDTRLDSMQTTVNNIPTTVTNEVSEQLEDKNLTQLVRNLIPQYANNLQGKKAYFIGDEPSYWDSFLSAAGLASCARYFSHLTAAQVLSYLQSIAQPESYDIFFLSFGNRDGSALSNYNTVKQNIIDLVTFFSDNTSADVFYIVPEINTTLENDSVTGLNPMLSAISCYISNYSPWYYIDNRKNRRHPALDLFIYTSLHWNTPIRPIASVKSYVDRLSFGSANFSGSFRFSMDTWGRIVYVIDVIGSNLSINATTDRNATISTNMPSFLGGESRPLFIPVRANWGSHISANCFLTFGGTNPNQLDIVFNDSSQSGPWASSCRILGCGSYTSPRISEFSPSLNVI